MILSFIPASGIENSIIKVTGVNFKDVIKVEISNTTILKDNITVNPENTLLTFTLPKPVPNPTTQVRTKIVVETKYGIGTSVGNFIYNPAQTNPAAPAPDVNNGQPATSVTSQSPQSQAAQTNNQIGSAGAKTILVTSVSNPPAGLTILSAQINTQTPTWIFKNSFNLAYSVYKTQATGGGRFTYTINTLGPKKFIIVYDNGSKIYEGVPSAFATEQTLIDEAKAALLGTYGNPINSMTLVGGQSEGAQKEVIFTQGEIQLTGFISSDKKTFSMTRDDVIEKIKNNSVVLEVGMRIVVKADVFAEEPNNPTADRTILSGTIVY